MLYGIKTLSVFGDGLRAVLSECGRAAKSSDARDKYFLSSVSEVDLAPGRALRSELPALDAAQAALSATISELVDALPKLEMCGAHGFSRQRAAGNGTHVRQQILARVRGVAAPSGVDTDNLDSLLTAARAAVISMRSALA